MWVEAGGGKAIVRLDLLSCREVRGIPSPSHASAWKDIGNVTARAQALDDAGGVVGIDELCPFQMMYADGVERLGAGSPRERSRWIDAIRFVFYPFCGRYILTIGHLGMLSTEFPESLVHPASHQGRTSQAKACSVGDGDPLVLGDFGVWFGKFMWVFV
jgi:hypothetical protein